MKLVFLHGWGSGSFVWDKVTPAFSDYKVITPNLGFVGDETLPFPEEKFIGIGHSLGGQYLLKHYPDQLAGFVSIASFPCFYRHIPKQILEAMKRNIVKDSTRQIREFWLHAGLDQPGGLARLNPDQIFKGLVWLSQWDVTVPDNLPLKILASRDDTIVPEAMSAACWGHHPVHWRTDGGHMLPLTQAQWCINHIKEFLNEHIT